MPFQLPPNLRAFTAADPSAPESRWCLLVARQVSLYFVPKGSRLPFPNYRRELAQEMFNAGLAALIEKLTKQPDLPIHEQFKVVEHAINDAKLTDHSIYIDPNINRQRKYRWKKRGKKGELKLERVGYVRDNAQAETSILETLRQPEPERTDWPSIIECFTRIYAACRSDNERAVLDACWDEGRSIGQGPPRMPQLQKATGLSRNRILEAMDYLESEAIKILKWRKAKGNRRHRSGTCS